MTDSTPGARPDPDESASAGSAAVSSPGSDRDSAAASPSSSLTTRNTSNRGHTSPGEHPSPAGGPERSSRDQILRRTRAAAGRDGPASDADCAAADAEYGALPRDYLRAHHDPAGHDVVALFAERAADYRAVVARVPAGDVPAAIARVLAAGTFVVPAGLPPGWLARLPADSPDAVLTGDDPPLSAQALDAVAGVLTGCAVAIAETGTIVLDHGPGQGRRALTLVPDFHLVVVREDQIAADLAGAISRLDPARPHTLVSGPSATSDIELVRVEGVHGPRTLHVLIAGPVRVTG
jgi:L-lactate dehydrogenase complex protein LldG